MLVIKVNKKSKSTNSKGKIFDRKNKDPKKGNKESNKPIYNCSFITKKDNRSNSSIDEVGFSIEIKCTNAQYKGEYFINFNYTKTFHLFL